jgi:hypothetical protein
VLVLNDPSTWLFPRNIAADGSFRGLMLLVRDMCADGQGLTLVHF